jgi:hypothetical protein
VGLSSFGDSTHGYSLKPVQDNTKSIFVASDFQLNWRALLTTIRTENAAIAWFWSQYCLAIRTSIEELTCIFRHGLFFLEAAFRAGNHGL